MFGVKKKIREIGKVARFFHSFQSYNSSSSPPFIIQYIFFNDPWLAYIVYIHTYLRLVLFCGVYPQYVFESDPDPQRKYCVRKMELMNVVLCSLIGSFSRILMIFFPFSTDSVDDAQVSSKKVMSPDHPIVNYSFTLSIANLIES